MSAGAALQAAAVAALEQAGLGAVFDHQPTRAGLPFVEVEAPVLVDWSTKDWTGREARLFVRVHERAERPDGARGRLAIAEAAVLTLGGELGAGWRIANIGFVRGGVTRAGEGRWQGVAEFRVRMWRAS